MNNKSTAIESLLLSYKNNDKDDSRLVLPVRNENGRDVGYLACIDIGLAHDPSIVEAMTVWRRRYMKNFLTQFEATNARTKAWLF